MLLGLRYRHVVTLVRVSVVIIWFWLIGALTGCLRAQIQRIDLAYRETVVDTFFSKNDFLLHADSPQTSYITRTPKARSQ